LTQRQLPDWFGEWLDPIPVIMLCALIVPGLFATGTPRHLVVVDVKVAVALPTFAFAFKTRSLGGTVVVATALYWLAGFWR